MTRFTLLTTLVALTAVAVIGQMLGVFGAEAGLPVAVAAVLQTTYSERMPLGAAGLIASTHSYDADTKQCETEAGIGFGLAVSRGADPVGGAVLGGEAFIGISVRDVTLDPSANDKYPQYRNMSVLQRGDIWCQVAGEVTAGEPATYNSTTGVLSDRPVSATDISVPGGRWQTSAPAGGGLAILRLGDVTQTDSDTEASVGES